MLGSEPETRQQPVEATNSDRRGDLRVTYVPREDATPEGKLALGRGGGVRARHPGPRTEQGRRFRDKKTKGGGHRGAAAGPRAVNPIERREVVYDRIRLDPTIYEPINEELRKQSLEEVASRCFTIEAGLEENGSTSSAIPT